MSTFYGAQDFTQEKSGTFDTDVNNYLPIVALGLTGVCCELYVTVATSGAALHVGTSDATGTDSGLHLPADGITYSLGRVRADQNLPVDGAGGVQSTGKFTVVPYTA